MIKIKTYNDASTLNEIDIKLINRKYHSVTHLPFSFHSYFFITFTSYFIILLSILFSFPS